MGRDSNPRYGFPYSSFQDCRLRPLGHPSRKSPRLLYPVADDRASYQRPAGPTRLTPNARDVNTYALKYLCRSTSNLNQGNPTRGSQRTSTRNQTPSPPTREAPQAQGTPRKGDGLRKGRHCGQDSQTHARGPRHPAELGPRRKRVTQPRRVSESHGLIPSHGVTLRFLPGIAGAPASVTPTRPSRRSLPPRADSRT